MSGSRITHSTSITERAWFIALLRVIVIAGSLFGGIALAFLLVLGGLDPMLPLAAAVAIAVLVLALRFGSNELGLLAAAVAGGMLSPFAIPTGTESRVPISMVIMLALLGVWLLQIITGQAKRPWLRPSPINGFVLAFIGVTVFSFVWSSLLRDPLVYIYASFLLVQIAALVLNCALPLTILLMLNKINNITFWKRLVWLTLLIGLLGIWSEILSLPTRQYTSNGMRGLTSMWCGGFALALLLYDRKLNLVKIGVIALVIGGFTWKNLLGNTIWLSGWVPMVAAWVILLWFRSKKLFLLAVVVGLGVAAMYAGDIYANVVQTNIDEGSTSRWDIWALSLDHVRRHPLFGTGPAGYAVYYMTYNPLDARSTHNNFFDILAQSGIVGLLAFVALLVRLARMGLRNISAAQHQDDFTKAFSAMTLAGVGGAAVGMMLGDWVLPFAYNQTITGFDNAIFTWLFFGGIASLDWLLRTGRIPTETVSSALSAERAS